MTGSPLLYISILLGVLIIISLDFWLTWRVTRQGQQAGSRDLRGPVRLPALPWLRRRAKDGASVVPPAGEVGETAAGAELLPSAGLPANLKKAFILLLAVALIAASLWSQPGGPRGLNWLLLGLGLALLVAGRRSLDVDGLPGWLERLERGLRQGLGVSDWQVVCLALSPALAVIATLAAGVDAKMHQSVLAVAAWLGGIILVFVGGWQPLRQKPALNGRTLLVTGLLIGLAFLIRGVNTTHIPIVLSGDEASAGLSAVEFVKGNTNNIFRVGWFSFPSLYFYIQSIPIALLGQTIPALRLLSALVGALTVGAVYLLARPMFGPRAAFYAAFFLAAFHFHNNFSRIGLNNIWDGLWFVLVMGLLWLGWERESRLAFLGAGLAIGLAQYFYVTGRLLVGLAPAWLVVMALFDRPRFKRLWPSLLLMGLLALTSSLPLTWFFIRFPGEFQAPMNRVSILSEWMNAAVQNSGVPAWLILLKQVLLGLEGYTHVPLQVWYQPGTPLLRPFSAALFLLGAGLLLARPRDGRTLLLGMWVAAFGLISGLSESTPAAQRYVAAAPAAALLVGYGLAEITDLLCRLWPRRSTLLGVFSVLVLVGMSADELDFYFLEYTPRSDFGGDHSMIAQSLADYLQARDSQWQVLFFGFPHMGYYSISSLPYLAPHITGVEILHPWGSPENPPPVGDHLIFAFLRNHGDDLAAVQASYPGGNLRTYYTRSGEVLYWLYEYSPQTAAGSTLLKSPPPSPYPYPLLSESDAGVYP